MKTYSALAATAAATLALAACGGSGSPTSSGSASGGPMAGETVSVKQVQGVGSVLVDSHGAALYSPAQEAAGKVRCTGSCTSIWIPLRLPNGTDRPAASSGLMANLGVVARPGGSRQVTFDGRPLYRFAEDSKPGVVSGNNVTDSFDGKRFTWHVASTGRASSAGSTPSSRAYGY